MLVHSLAILKDGRIREASNRDHFSHGPERIVRKEHKGPFQDCYVITRSGCYGQITTITIVACGNRDNFQSPYPPTAANLNTAQAIVASTIMGKSFGLHEQALLRWPRWDGSWESLPSLYISVCDNCNANINSCTAGFGDAYANDS
jgi:hypothetical protein